MPFRVPLLLEVVEAVVHRLDTTATRAVNPAGPQPQGYDDVFREPVVTDPNSGSSVDARVESRVELAAVRVPCQVETTLFDELRMGFAGNLPQNRVTLVFHRQDLQMLNLIDLGTGNIQIGVGDRVSRLERKGLGVPVLSIREPGLYITEIIPASWGFGPDGHDLHLAILESRDRGVIGGGT